ncbi:hypothetical protein RFI_19487 [Reticulomyxa filosa]|uniref:DUF547 domain-containing protein n=1 Tax=Reticulomyxa filosa TaxID=46433 RepID=X6MWG0_RETFI|nr:hypothetical protein RFI_19487 [Reticulomyxa filosa]|eukprot:ETO17822.1 hypothetical protein RFI_19487 [Reticulomyxa filosa]
MCTYIYVYVYISKEKFNYHIWSKILRRYVDPCNGKVNFEALYRHKEKVDEFIACLSVFGPNSTPHAFTTMYDRMAYYINAYNALVIFAILEFWPINSILDIRTGFLCLSSVDPLHCHRGSVMADNPLTYLQSCKHHSHKSKRNNNNNNNNGIYDNTLLYDYCSMTKHAQQQGRQRQRRATKKPRLRAGDTIGRYRYEQERMVTVIKMVMDKWK